MHTATHVFKEKRVKAVTPTVNPKTEMSKTNTNHKFTKKYNQC